MKPKSWKPILTSFSGWLQRHSVKQCAIVMLLECKQINSDPVTSEAPLKFCMFSLFRPQISHKVWSSWPQQCQLFLLLLSTAMWTMEDGTGFCSLQLLEAQLLCLESWLDLDGWDLQDSGEPFSYPINSHELTTPTHPPTHTHTHLHTHAQAHTHTPTHTHTHLHTHTHTQAHTHTHTHILTHTHTIHSFATDLETRKPTTNVSYHQAKADTQKLGWILLWFCTDISLFHTYCVRHCLKFIWGLGLGLFICTPLFRPLWLAGKLALTVRFQRWPTIVL